MKNPLKQKLLSASAKAIKVCAKFDTSEISFNRLHEMFERSNPENFLLYKHALALFKIYNSNTVTQEFAALNLVTVLTSRQVNFMAKRENNRRVGLNALSNRFYILNNRIPLVKLNLGIESFKIFCKGEFLSN